MEEKLTVIRGKDLPFGISFKVRKGDKIDFLELPYENYFYIDFEQYINFKDQLEQHHISKLMKRYDIIDNRVKVFPLDNWKRQPLRKALEDAGFKTYEADISAYKRYLIEHQDWQLNPEGLVPLWYDIETKDDGAFNKDKSGSIIATEPVLSVYFENAITGEGCFFKNMNKNDPITGERDLLIQIKAVMEQFDIDLAWNGKRFDDTYIKQRNDFHGIKNDHFEYLNQMDYMEMVKKNYKGLESFSLDGVSKAILGEGKLDVGGEKGKGAIYKAWLDSFDGDTRLEEYNKEDVRLMAKIEEKLQFINLHMKQAELCHCFIQETLHNTDMIDYALLNKTYNLGLQVDSKPNDDLIAKHEELGNIGGAYTFCLQPGFHKEVWVFDFKSYYATTIAQYNICVSTIGDKKYFEEKGIPYCTIPEDQMGEVYHPPRYYRTDKRGFISELVESWVTERDKIKYEMDQYQFSDPEKYRQMYLHQYALKTMGNSVYGALAFKYFRFFNWHMGDSITTGCRILIKRCIEKAESLGFIVVQGDTDSIIFKKGPDCHMEPLELEKAFEVMFDEYAEEVGLNGNFDIPVAGSKETKKSKHFIVFEHEKTLKTMLAIKKKNYASLMLVKDKSTGEMKEKIDIKGLECKKKDTNPLAKILQKNLVEDILREKFDRDSFVSMMQELRFKTENHELDKEYLIMKKSLGQPLEYYDGYIIDKKTGQPKVKADGTLQKKTLLAHVKVAMRMQEQGYDVYPGDRIAYIVKNRVPKIDPITIDEFDEEPQYDHAYYWERITKPIIKILAGFDRPLAIENALLLILQDRYTKSGNERKELTLDKAQVQMQKLLNKIIEEEEDDSIEYHGEKFKND